MKLGKLNIVNPREIWNNEERDFTPWLADNIEYLSEVIGFTIEIEEIEKQIGSYELDIYGKIEGTDKKVVIENQLESSDHRHLGQLITYASGLDASVIIWVTPSVNDEHRKAIEWLNEISESDKNFFLIRPEVIRVDNSDPAVRFQVESSPSDFERTMKNVVSGKDKERNLFRRVFWSKLIDFLSANNYKWAQGRRTTPDSWLSFSVGNSNYNVTVSMAMHSRLRVEIGFISTDKEINKINYDRYYKEKELIESKLQDTVSWEKLDDKKMSRIAVYCEYEKDRVNIDMDYNDELYHWIEGNLVAMRELIHEIGY